MINPFRQVAQLKKMRDQAMQIQRELAAQEVTVEKNGVSVVISGDQKIRELTTNNRQDADIQEAVNEAIKKSQEIAARKLQQMGGGLQSLLGGLRQ